MSSTQQPPKPLTRDERRAEALRANLSRRKDQQRARESREESREDKS